MHQPHHYTLEIHYVNRPKETRRIDARRVVIGRDGGDIVLGDTQASAAHAEIEFENGQLVVRDLGSTNGTWLGERNLPQFALSPGQVFRCGHTQIRLLEIIGGQPLVAGRTMMADRSQLPPLPGVAPQAPTSSPAPASAAPAPAPAPASPAKPNTGAIVAATIGGAVFLAAAVTGAWFVFLRDAPDDTQELAQVEPEPEPAPPQIEPPPEPPPGPQVEPVPVDPDFGALYRKVGAATVVIRVPGSVGSGAVIDPSGVILTNHHVIDGGEREGLNIKAKVVFGDYSEELRTFEPRHEQLEAWVIKVNEEHDLALIKLINPPADLPYITLAGENPYPGQRVAALGHAGVGMLWAIKGGEISAAGSLAGHTELLLDANEGDREYLEKAKKRFEKMGRVIQSTAKILPGDSGGPLVNLASEIVGVNAFGRIDRGTNQWLSFHIHRAEVAAFIAEIPTRPLAVVPDPWDHAGEWSRVEDATVDGKADVLLISGELDSGYSYRHSGALIDLDGDSFATGGGPSELNPKIAELVESKGFDAEFAVLHEPHGDSHYWYDRDGVDGFDLYLLGKNSRTPTEAWSLDRFGGAEKLDGLELGNGLRPELFSDAALAKAFQTIAARVFPGQVAAGAADIPIPNHVVDGEIEFVDGDGDGLNDTVFERSTFDQRAFFDLDQNSIGRMASGEALKVVLEAASVDMELAIVRQSADVWAFYDRDDDGSYDLVVHGRELVDGIVHAAFTLAGDGEPIPAPEQVGRRLLRPGLLSKPELATRLAKHPFASWTAAASDDGLASFPSLAPGPYASILVTGNQAQVTDLGHDLTLVDVDGDSSGGDEAATAALVADGSYDAEFALLDYGGVVWAFYDRDGDGRFDWVLVAIDGQRETATHGYEVGATTATLRPEAGGTALISAEVFTDASLRDRFAAVKGSL